MATEILEPRVHIIASTLDYPSVYMGGPSKQSIQKAERIIAALEREGYVLADVEASDKRIGMLSEK
jgi:hypothetical protein